MHLMSKEAMAIPGMIFARIRSSLHGSFQTIVHLMKESSV